MAENTNEASAVDGGAPRPAPQGAGLNGDIVLDEVLVGSRHTLNEDDIVVEGPLIKEGGGIVGLVLLALAIAGFVAGGVYLYSSEERRAELAAFWSGNIKEYKQAGKKEEEAWQRRVNMSTRNLYGSVVLEYSPKDARVTLNKMAWTESVDEFIDRKLKGGEDKRKGPTIEMVPNKTIELKDKEMVDSLPLSDLALLERTEDDKDMVTFAYEVILSKEGYYDRKFLFITDDFPGQATDDHQVLKWQQAGPDVFAVPWSGADLMPKPEMMRPNYVRTIVELNCLKQSPEGKKKSQDELDYEFTVLKRRNSFATDVQWNEVEAALRANAELWPQIEEEIAAGQCE